LLLGLHAHVALSQAAAIRDRLAELTEYYRRWARDAMPSDEDDVATFCYFLTTEAGRALRLEGVVWIAAALATNESFRRGATGNNVAEAIDTILTHHAVELVAQPAARNAIIDVVARLVRAQVATAMGLQQRIAALR